MFSINKKLALAAVPAVLLGATSVMAETLIVRSNGPSAKSFPPGKALPSNAKVALKEGDTLTILDSRGTSVLRGPGNFTMTTTTATGSSLGQFLRNTGGRQARTGATRSLGGAGKILSPNIWFVDVSKAGNICLADTTAATLWRPDSTSAGTLTLTRESDGKSTTLPFGAGQSARGWPTTAVPLVNNTSYRIAGAGLPTPVTVKVVTVGASEVQLDSVAAKLIQNNCSAQTNLLVETTLHVEMTAPQSDTNS